MNAPEPEQVDIALVVNEDGSPRGMVDIAEIQSKATILMYWFAAAAGDDDEIDRIACDWVDNLEPDELGYIATAALPLLVRCVLAPVLEVLSTLSPEVGTRMRSKLAESRDYARATLGGGR